MTVADTHHSCDVFRGTNFRKEATPAQQECAVFPRRSNQFSGHVFDVLWFLQGHHGGIQIAHQAVVRSQNFPRLAKIHRHIQAQAVHAGFGQVIQAVNHGRFTAFNVFSSFLKLRLYG